MFVIAANQVRRNTELNHDYEFQRKLVTLTVDGVTGGSLDNAVLYGTATTVVIKTIVEMGLFDEDANLRPVEWTTVAESMERQRGDNPGENPRYPTDAWYVSGPEGQARFTIANNTVYRFPKDEDNDFSIGMEVYVWNDDWTASDVEDEAGTTNVWTREGGEYLMWGTVVHLNHLFKEFVYRQEGNLPSPEKLRDTALENFKEWDSHKYEQFRRRGR